mgnify:FL=1
MLGLHMTQESYLLLCLVGTKFTFETRLHAALVIQMFVQRTLVFVMAATLRTSNWAATYKKNTSHKSIPNVARLRDLQ